MEVLLTLVVGALCIVCFFVGAKVGQQASKGEPITTPEVNPMKIIQKQREEKAAKEEEKKFDKIMRNIDIYDGTDSGQEDI